jgi:hypothetical protein
MSMGSIPVGVSALVTGNLMGRRFGWVVDSFFLGGCGRGRGTPGHVLQFVSSEVPNSPYLVFYYVMSSGGFVSVSSDHHEGSPGPWCPGQTRGLFKFRQPDDLFYTLKTVKGGITSFLLGLQGTVGMVSYEHTVYVTYYFCHMFSLGRCQRANWWTS